jgi:hypothetical protein
LNLELFMFSHVVWKNGKFGGGGELTFISFPTMHIIVYLVSTSQKFSFNTNFYMWRLRFAPSNNYIIIFILEEILTAFVVIPRIDILLLSRVEYGALAPVRKRLLHRLPNRCKASGAKAPSYHRFCYEPVLKGHYVASCRASGRRTFSTGP